MRKPDNMPNRRQPTQSAGSLLLSVLAVCGLIVGVLSLWSDVPVVGAVMALVSAAVLFSQYDYYWRRERREFDS